MLITGAGKFSYKKAVNNKKSKKQNKPANPDSSSVSVFDFPPLGIYLLIYMYI
jgi:hypothetical protein